jgi:imidazolonepropionase-like amidohydrolase
MSLKGKFGTVAALCVVLSATAFANTAGSEVTAITGAKVVSLDGGRPIDDAVVVIEGGEIVRIGAADSTPLPDGAGIIRADGTWLIPGLMNMHVHFGLKLPGKMQAELANETVPELTLRMAANARASLLAGVTTVRMTGEQSHTGIALRKAIDKGEIPGPRIFTAGDGVSITGGHGGKRGETFDGPYEVVKAARREISAGASWVKIAISGGIATDGGDIAEALMTPEEISAVIDAAHRFGAKVAAHSGSSAATTTAVEAGVDSIEHGYTLDRQILKRMAREGTWFVPTIVVSQPATQPFFERIGSPDWYLERRESVGRQHWQALEMAIEEGVNIALGSDQHPHEPNDGTTATVREAEYYVEAGMTPVQALRAATIEPARMLGVDSTVGSLEVGKAADIIAVAADPAEDISALREIVFVMKGGDVYKNEIGSL